MSYYAVQSGGLRVPLNPECAISLPNWKPVGTVEQTPTGRVYVTTDTPTPQPVQVTVAWVVRGVDAERAAAELGELVALLDGATRLYHGEAWLTVLRLADVSAPATGYAGLSWRGTHTYDLASPLFTDAHGRTGRMPGLLLGGS